MRPIRFPSAHEDVTKLVERRDREAQRIRRDSDGQDREDVTAGRPPRHSQIEQVSSSEGVCMGRVLERAGRRGRDGYGVISISSVLPQRERHRRGRAIGLNSTAEASDAAGEGERRLYVRLGGLNRLLRDERWEYVCRSRARGCGAVPTVERTRPL